LSQPRDVDRLKAQIATLQPAVRTPLDGPYHITNDLFRTLMQTDHDVGGEPTPAALFEEKEEAEWELNTYVTCESLGWRHVWNSEERRRLGNCELGRTLYLGIPYYGRWILAVAMMMLDKGHISLTELTEKMDEVRARYAEAEVRG
jgi:thiocyanate hydrolase subunit beta